MIRTILSITTQKPHSTGSGTYLTELVKAWNEAGCTQGVVAGVYSGDVVEFPEGVKFFPVYYTHPDEDVEGEIKFPIVGMSDVMPYTSTRYMDMTKEMIASLQAAFIPAIRAAVEEMNPDVIVCHHLFLLAAMVREAFPDRTVVGVCHGSDLRQMANCVNHVENYSDNQMDSEYIARNIGALDKIMLLHDEQIDKAKALYGATDEQIQVIGTGYNSKVFNNEGRKDSDDDVIRLTYAGKVCLEKGIAELIDALDSVCSDSSLPPVKMTILGGCKDLAIRRKLGGSEEPLPVGILKTEPYTLEYLGFVPQEVLVNTFKESDIFVLPSYYEGLPLVLIEAMSSGLETVCTNLPGVQGWLEKTIPGYNTKFVSMPRMATIDSPDLEYVHEFVAELGDVLRERIAFCRDNGRFERSHPDTTEATWAAVARRIVRNL